MFHTHLCLLSYNHKSSELTELTYLESLTLGYARPPWLHFDSEREVNEIFMPPTLTEESKATSVYIFISKAECCLPFFYYFAVLLSVSLPSVG